MYRKAQSSRNQDVLKAQSTRIQGDLKTQSSRNQNVLAIIQKPSVEVRPAITSGHAHVVTDNEIVKKGERKKRFPEVRWRSCV